MANGDTNLEALVGEWSMEATFPFDPPIAGRGRVSFERLSGELSSTLRQAPRLACRRVDRMRHRERAAAIGRRATGHSAR